MAASDASFTAAWRRRKPACEIRRRLVSTIASRLAIATATFEGKRVPCGFHDPAAGLHAACQSPPGLADSLYERGVAGHLARIRPPVALHPHRRSERQLDRSGCGSTGSRSRSSGPTATSFLWARADLHRLLRRRSSLKPDTRYEVEVSLPDSLQPGQFQGLFFENVEAEFTGQTRPAGRVAVRSIPALRRLASFPARIFPRQIPIIPAIGRRWRRVPSSVCPPGPSSPRGGCAGNYNCKPRATWVTWAK